MIIVVAIIAAAVFVAVMAVVLYFEQLDKETRQAQGLPPRKYHDVTDYDITVVDTIHHK